MDAFCDTCGHRAWVSVVIGSFTSPEWFYCKHHFDAHEAWLRVNALLIVDWRDKILGEPDVVEPKKKKP